MSATISRAEVRNKVMTIAITNSSTILYGGYRVITGCSHVAILNLLTSKAQKSKNMAYLGPPSWCGEEWPGFDHVLFSANPVGCLLHRDEG